MKMARGKFQGEIATKPPRPRSRSTFDSPVGPGIVSRSPKQAPPLRSVVAAEIDRLTYFGDTVVQCLTAFQC